MCIARVGRVVETSSGRATVEFFDGRSLENVDLSVTAASLGDFVEVFGNLALSVLSPREARARKKAWGDVRRAAEGMPVEVSRR